VVPPPPPPPAPPPARAGLATGGGCSAGHRPPSAGLAAEWRRLGGMEGMGTMPSAVVKGAAGGRDVSRAFNLDNRVPGGGGAPPDKRSRGPRQSPLRDSPRTAGSYAPEEVAQ